MSSDRSFVHPLFDDNSFYRLSTRESVWHDGGNQSVMDFFLSQYRQELRREWQVNVPDQAQEYRFGDVLDRALDVQRRRVAGTPLQSPLTPPKFALLGKGRDEMPEPALLRVDLTEDKPIDELRTEDISRGSPSSLVYPSWSNSQGDKFAVGLAGVPKGRRCLVLIITLKLLEQLHGVLSGAATPSDSDLFPRSVPQEPIGNEASALTAISRTISPSSLRPQSPTDSATVMAYRLSVALGCAPALEGTSSDDERFHVTVDLPAGCPPLEAWTWVLCCIGPSLPDV